MAGIVQTQDTAEVTGETVVWGIILHTWPGRHLHMGVGWPACLRAVKLAQTLADEATRDRVTVSWTGTGNQCYTWEWSADTDAPDALPEPIGITLDKQMGA